MLRRASKRSRGRAVAGITAIAVLMAVGAAVEARAEFPGAERNTVRTAGHSAWGLCGTDYIHPVAAFDREYTDPVGNHYHLWLPPAGPPFAELCLKSPLSDYRPLP